MTTDSGRKQTSVIVPVYNDPKGIQITLESLLVQEYNDYVVVPVDNDSNDRTGDAIAKITASNPERIQPCEELDVQSSYAARNTGVDHSRGDILLFLDADMWVPETWIGDMVTALETHDYDYLGCNVEVVTDDVPTFPERYERTLSFPVESYLERKHFAPTCALAVRREVFEEVGLFDHRLESGGDKEFGQRVHRAGFEQGYTDDVTAYHPARDSLGALRSKAQRIGRGRAQMRYYHPEVGNYPNPLHPINYLPPSPWRLRSRHSGDNVSIPSMLAFYLLEYVLKLTQSINFVCETAAIKRNK